MLVYVIEFAFIEIGVMDLRKIESQAISTIGAEVGVIKICNSAEHCSFCGQSTHVRGLFDGSDVAPSLTVRFVVEERSLHEAYVPKICSLLKFSLLEVRWAVEAGNWDFLTLLPIKSEAGISTEHRP